MFRSRRTSGRRGGCAGWLVLILVVVGGGWLALTRLGSGPLPAPAASGLAPVVARIKSLDPSCAAPGWLGAAEANATSLQTLAFTPWGAAEAGWEIYAPLVGQEIGSRCSPETEGFAAALSRWQAGRGLGSDGRMSAATFDAMRVVWLRRRPFVLAMSSGCPLPATDANLTLTDPKEAYGGQPLMVRPAALDAYRRMVASARADSADIASDPRALTIISAFRSPQLDGTDCPAGQLCDRHGRANCSAHRTGLAMDLYVGAAPGADPTSTDSANRLAQSRTPAYRWLVANAARFGFLPYPFEPWHWEWTGEPP